MAKTGKSPRARAGKVKDEVVSRVKRMLPCEIDEKITKKKEKRIVHALTDRKEEQEKMNAEILPRRKRIKELDGEIETLRSQIEKGTEDREVLCEVVKDFTHHKVLVRRRDTGDVVEDRTMTEEDRQEDLLKGGGRKGKRGAEEEGMDAEDEAASRASADVEGNDPGEGPEDDDDGRTVQ